MRNFHMVQGWKLTPAACRSSYASSTEPSYGLGVKETITVTQLDSGKGADGYHVESPTGACFFVQKWDTDNTWTSQKLEGNVASAMLKHGSPTLRLLLERLRSTARVLELEAQLRGSLAR